MFSCKDKYCKARAKFLLKSEFVKRKVTPRPNGFPKVNSYIDREDSKLRDLSNWTVKNLTCQFVHSARCEVDFYGHLRLEFRTDQTEKAILIKKQVVPETLSE